ncbi:MAG: M23 family metallopeptidase, partial [Deltaproteobacteria bacterium]|nr:M23 family metallopeptidase [Deltaproteobacteria bacterium]
PIMSELRQFKLGGKTGKNSKDQFAFNDLQMDVNTLQGAASKIEERLHKVYEVRQEKRSFWAAIPSLWPVQGFVTSGFGYRGATRVGGTRFHEGIDIASPLGTPVHASGDGIVTYAGYRGGFGKMVVIDHGFGLSTVYGHNAELYVQEGQRIRRGTVLASIGMTGRTSGPHLHYEVLVDGVPVDPMRYLARR